MNARLFFHSLPFCFGIFLASAAALSGQTAQPSDFLGFWQMQEPAGDQCVVNIKLGRRASCFYIGSASSDLMKGRWAIEGDRLIITWSTGSRDVFKKWGEGTLERQAYHRDQALTDAPAYETRAVRLDPRLPGSLTTDRDPADQQVSTPAPTADSESPAVPMRNPYIGYWEVEQSPGMFFGLIGDASDRFFLFLDRDGHASVTLRKGFNNTTLRGTWEFVDGEARITWPNQRKDALVKAPKGGFRLHSFGKRDQFTDRPNEKREARLMNANEAAHYFNSADVRLLTMTDIRGLWAPVDPNLAEQNLVNILGWGNAQLQTPETGEIITRGTWKLFNDHVVVTWDDGSTDVLRNNLRFWQQERYAPGESTTARPLQNIRVTKISGDGVGPNSEF